MKPIYINGSACVSAQKTVDSNVFLEEPILQEANILSIVPPPYKEYIPRKSLRRMAKGVKIGIIAAQMALQQANVTQPDAILTGSGLGCLRDSEKFLERILDNDEQFLSPTAFIQSTHNTVGAQIALALKCPHYNMTYVHGSISFESALLDAWLLLEEAGQQAKHVLVGGIEEMGDHTTQLFQLIHHIKPQPVHTLQLLDSSTKGTIYSEGAQFFVLSNQQQDHSYASIRAMETISQLPIVQLEDRLRAFLARQQLQIEDIDLVILGNNGDSDFDHFYHTLQNGVLKSTAQVYYKHLSGEYYTASAFACWLAAQILKRQEVPDVLRLNQVATSKKTIHRILLYHQYRGENHGFLLMETV